MIRTLKTCCLSNSQIRNTVALTTVTLPQSHPQDSHLCYAWKLAVVTHFTHIIHPVSMSHRTAVNTEDFASLFAREVGL